MKFSTLGFPAAALSVVYFVGCSSSTTRGSQGTLAVAKGPTSSNAPFAAAVEDAPVLPWEQIDRREPVAAETLLEKLSTKSATPAMRLLTRYVEADIWSTHDASKSCTLWSDLLTRVKTDKDFPLLPVARLHAEEVCAVSNPSLKAADAATKTDDDEDANDLSDAPRPSQPWLRELKARVALKVALRTHDAGREMRASSEVASFEHVQKVRVKLIQRAVELATQLKQDALRAQYQAQLEKTAPRFIEHPQPEQRMSVAGDFKQARQFDAARKMYTAIFSSSASSDVEKSRALEGIRMSFKLQKNTDRFIKATEAFASFARVAFYFPVDMNPPPKSSAKGSAKSKNRSVVKSRKRTAAGKKVAVNKHHRNRKGPAPANADDAIETPRGTQRTLPRFLDAQVTYARAVWTEHDPKLAEQILLKAEADIAGRISTAESSWVRARIAEEAGDLPRALGIFAQIDPSKVENSELRTKIFWNNAWDLRKAGRKEEAAAKLQLLTGDRSLPNATRAQFWLGRTLHDLGKEKEASDQYEQLIKADPMGIYGLLAYRELKRPIPPLAPMGPDAIAPSLKGESRRQFQWLAAAGENELAQSFLDQTSASQRASFNEAQMLDLLQLYAQAGSYQTLFARLNDLSPSVRNGILQNHPELLFPQPWRSVAAESAAKSNIPIELIYSIMRQESSYNPNARSAADAFGLMQLIPEMAERAAKTVDIKLQAHEDLFDPLVNIPLGAAFLHQLLTFWHGQFVLAVASYNASEGAIKGWVKSRFKSDPLEFIEDVPYEETRSYIKLVLRNFIFYSRLNSGGQSLPFPEQCLENIQRAKP